MHTCGGHLVLSCIFIRTFFFFEKEKTNSVGFYLQELCHLLSHGTNCAEENPLVRWGVLPGSNADNSQILSTAIGVEKKAIIFAVALCCLGLAWVLIRGRGLGKAIVSSFFFSFLEKKMPLGIRESFWKRQARNKWNK